MAMGKADKRIGRPELKGCWPADIIDLKVDKTRADSVWKLSFSGTPRIVEVRIGGGIVYTHRVTLLSVKNDMAQI